MSRFLGPIHYWLYNKIQVQQEFVESIVKLGKEKWQLELEQILNERYGLTQKSPLEEVIDESNIHGWLQEQVSLTEYKLAYSVTQILEGDESAITTLETLFYEKGKAKRSSIDEDLSVRELYKAVSDTLIDGMPCDHVNDLIEDSEEKVVWRRNKCVHAPYWNEVGGDVGYYYKLREAWLKGFVEGGNETFENLDEVTYAILKKSKTSVEIMVEEHENIRRMLKVVRRACLKLLKEDSISYEDFNDIIDFIRNYADTHHHGKEEQFLFKYMESHLGELGIKLIRNGMYVEHDLGRLYVKDLEEALENLKAGNEESKLDVIAHAIGYTNLLERHISKENEVVYSFGERKLPVEILEDVNAKTIAFEKEAQLKGIQEKYIRILEGLEDKYND